MLVCGKQKVCFSLSLKIEILILYELNVISRTIYYTAKKTHNLFRAVENSIEHVSQPTLVIFVNSIVQYCYTPDRSLIRAQQC